MTPQQIFNQAYYRAQDPRKQPLYNSRPGAPNEGMPQLSEDAITALIGQLIASGVPVDEQIDYWGWDAATVMADRLMQNVLWVSAGLGNVISAQVIVSGEYSGPMPATGAIKTSVNPADYPAWPSEAPAPPPPPADPVGVNEIGPYYQPLGVNPPFGTKYTDARGTFKLVQIPNQFAIGGGGFMTLWQLL